MTFDKMCNQSLLGQLIRCVINLSCQTDWLVSCKLGQCPPVVGHSDIARELLGACVCVAGVCAKVKSLGNMTALRVAGCFVVEIIREED